MVLIGQKAIAFLPHSNTCTLRDSVSKLEKLVAFYVDEHNTRLPHSAFRGQTPDEMYLGSGDQIPIELEAARRAARKSRIDVNRAMTCSTCVPLT